LAKILLTEIMKKKMDPQPKILRSVFSYRTLRIDYFMLKNAQDSDTAGNPWTDDRSNATARAKAQYGYLAGFKL
jgi:hypothetical protein